MKDEAQSLAENEELRAENERLLLANESLRSELETIRSKKVILKKGVEHLIEILEAMNRELRYPI